MRDDRSSGLRPRSAVREVSNEQVPAERIDVAVDDGWLTLKGEVKHQYETDAAFEAVRRLPGVGGIINEIKVITAAVDG